MIGRITTFSNWSISYDNLLHDICFLYNVIKNDTIIRFTSVLHCHIVSIIQSKWDIPLHHSGHKVQNNVIMTRRRLNVRMTLLRRAPVGIA